MSVSRRHVIACLFLSPLLGVGGWAAFINKTLALADSSDPPARDLGDHDSEAQLHVSQDELVALRYLQSDGLGFFWRSLGLNNPEICDDLYRELPRVSYDTSAAEYFSGIVKTADAVLPSPDQDYVRFLLSALVPLSSFASEHLINRYELHCLKHLHSKLSLLDITFKLVRDETGGFSVKQRLSDGSSPVAIASGITIIVRGDASFGEPLALRDYVDLMYPDFPSRDEQNNPPPIDPHKTGSL